MSRRERQRERVPHPASQSVPAQDREIGHLGPPHSGLPPAQLAPGERVDAPKLTAPRLPGFDAELPGSEPIRPATAHEVVQRGLADRETHAQMVHVPVPRIVIQREVWSAEKIRALLDKNPREGEESSLDWTNRLQSLFGKGKTYTQKDWGDNVTAIKGEVAKRMKSEQQKTTATQAGPWRFEAADLSAEPPKGAWEDLQTLLREANQLFKDKSGTIVGGKGVTGKAFKKIDGLTNTTARIDTQNPIAKGVHNVQYQVGGVSYAGVKFTNEDSEGQVKANLRHSFHNHQMAVSPNVPD